MLRAALLLTSLIPVLAVAQDGRKLAVMPLTAGAGVEPALAKQFEEALVGQLRRNPGVVVVTRDDLAALLSHEQLQQLLGCTDDACAGNLGGMAGATELVTGSIGRIGKSWMIHLRRLDVAKAATVREIDRRLKGARVDAVLDALPQMVRELLAGALPKNATPLPTVSADAADCPRACTNILACQGKYNDGDLTVLSGRKECEQRCREKTTLSPSGLAHPGKWGKSWACATFEPDCGALDDVCDVF